MSDPDTAQDPAFPVPPALPGIPGMRPAAAPHLLGRGWDNEMHLLGQLADGTRVVLRQPHRALGREILRHEIAVLPRIAALLDRERAPAFLVPRVLATIGEDERGGPAAVVTWIDGEVVADAVLRADAARTARLAARLGRALAALHRPAPAEHRRSTFRGVPLAAIRDRAAADLATLRGSDPALRPAPEHLCVIEREMRRGLAAPPWDGPDLLLHGDPHPANLVETPEGELGLIDWGDTTAGDPASDAGQLFVLDPGGAAWRAYRDAREPHGDPEALETRSRAWAVRFAGLIIAHAVSGGDGAQAPLEACARRLLSAWSADQALSPR
ncbi:phosphotransferase [Brachybacterium hainanense]|uniref:Phosphotransferase n=1 Tax=Brachybacterium hainanense TaxID=1541174 RepID=A0ABV6RH68_9MICO